MTSVRVPLRQGLLAQLRKHGSEALQRLILSHQGLHGLCHSVDLESLDSSDLGPCEEEASIFGRFLENILTPGMAAGAAHRG